MNDTGSYAARKNARRAAEKMIADGKAPAVDYGITLREDGRFLIKWKVKRAPTTEQVEAELTAATEAVTSGSEPATADTTRTEPESAEAEDPFPAGTWVKVSKNKRKAIVGQVTQRIGSNTWRVHQVGKPETWTQ